MLQVREVIASSILTPQKMGSLSTHYDYSLNPYAGCAFSCSYCYVPKFPNQRHLPAEWGTWVEVKLNAPDLIRKDRSRIFGSSIFFSSATDPYQYLELKYRITRHCLTELVKYRPKRLTLHTRSHLIMQDIELLKAFGDALSVGVSITTDSDEIAREFEPKAPSISRRLEMIRCLRENGIRVYASIAPLLPCDPDRLVSLLSGYVDSLWIDNMNWPEVNTRPQLLEKYADFFTPINTAVVASRITSNFKLVRSNRLLSTKKDERVSAPTPPAVKTSPRLATPMQLKLALSF